MRYYYVVKLEDDDDASACAGRTKREAIELLHADPSLKAENKRVLSMRIRAADACSARLQAGNHPWIWGMKLSYELA